MQAKEKFNLNRHAQVVNLAQKKKYLSRFIELKKCAKPWHMNRNGIAVNGLT